MEHSSLLTNALNLTLFGMGFVFLFLALLVLATKLMSFIIQAISKSNQHNSFSGGNEELDEETKFVIEQAIKLHRGA